MRVLHVLPSLDQMYGGPLRAVIDLSFESRIHGLESEIVGFGDFNIPDCPLPREAFHCLSLDQPEMFRYSRRYKPWLNANLRSFDGVVIHGMWQYPNWATYQACRQLGVKYVCFPHGMLDRWSVDEQGWFKQLKKTAYWYARENRIFAGAECVFYTTRRERTVSSATFRGMKHDRIVVPYGIANAPEGVHSPASPDLRLHPGAKAALFLGRVHPKKNVHFLVETWCQAQVPDNWELIIAGPAEAPYLTQLKQLAARHPRGKSVRFVGAVSGTDKIYLLQTSSWFLLPSKQENFGVAVLEAISHNCPVAISCGVYLADDLHSESEILPLQKEHWISFFEQRMADEQWRTRLCSLDQQILKPKFHIDKIAKSWADTLHSVFADVNHEEPFLSSSAVSNAS